MERYLTMFMEHLRTNRRLASNTLDGYRRDLADLVRFLAGLGIADPREATSRHLAAYLTALRGQARSNATVQRRAVSARAFFGYLAERRLIEVNPAIKLEAPPIERKAPRILSEEETDRLLAAASDDTPGGIRDRTMLETLYASGLRVSELLALNVGDVRIDLGLIVCVGPGGRERMVPIGSLCAEWMVKYELEARPALLKEGKPQEALFLNHLGGRMTRQGFWKRMKAIAAASGVDEALSPHALRNSFAAHLLARGADVQAVQEMMGHAAAASTQFYQPKPAVKSRLKEVYDRAHPRSRKDN